MKKRKKSLHFSVFIGGMCISMWIGAVCLQPVRADGTFVPKQENAVSDKKEDTKEDVSREQRTEISGKQKEEIEVCLETAKKIFAWKKKETNSGRHLLSGKNLTQAAQADLDWYVLAMARIGYEEECEAYAQAMKQEIAKLYEREEKIDANQATIWHRLILTLLAVGEDPANLAGNDGSLINLVADGIYDRGKTASLGQQGLNGYIWGLIALDSMPYAVPEGAYDTRNSILKAILAAQNEDGGFGLGGAVSDVDMTAMALQALAPYELYARQLKGTRAQEEAAEGAAEGRAEKAAAEEIGEAAGGRTEEETNKKQNISSDIIIDEVDTALYPQIEEAVDRALLYLQAHQQKNGAMGNAGQAVLESTAQTIVALSALKIDIKTETSFIKDGKTLLDGLLSFRCADGSFRHLPDEEEGNSISSAQAACALTAYIRVLYRANSLYDMRPEHTAVGMVEKESQEPMADYGQLKREEQEKTDQSRRIFFIIITATVLAAGAGSLAGMKKRQKKKARMEDEWNE